ncbi:hypothetical protein K8I31_18805, partial [bacterium]|nr:hypothetical protein [bacterium]
EYLKPGAVPEQITFYIAKPGTYDISMWVPTTPRVNPIQFNLAVYQPAMKQIIPVQLENPITNGWNKISTAEWSAGAYNMIFLDINTETVFDAIKIERVQDKYN